VSGTPARAAAPGQTRGALAVRLFACFAAGFFMSYGLRAINAVLAPELVAAADLSHAQLGSLSSAYFLTFALMQLPLGVWLDRYGPRRVDAVLMGVAALGCAIMATASSFAGLWIGRALIGAGVSAALMSSLIAFRQWFPPDRQTRLAAWMMTAGVSGVLMATVPVHRALPVLGWRGVFWVAAGVLAAIGVAMWLLLPRGHERRAGATQTFTASLTGYRAVFASGYFWQMTLAVGVSHGGFVALQSLWVGPWFDRVLGFDGAARADRLFLFNLALMGWFFALGWLAPRVGPGREALARVVVAGTACVVAAELAIAWAGGPSAWWLWMLLGAAATVFTLMQPRVALAFPPHLSGRALTGYNLVIFSWMFVTQWGFGVAVDAFQAAGHAEPQAFRATMAGLAALHAAGLAAFVLWPRRWRGASRSAKPEEA